jgi:hypothetical protein
MSPSHLDGVVWPTLVPANLCELLPRRLMVLYMQLYGAWNSLGALSIPQTTFPVPLRGEPSEGGNFERVRDL